MKQWILIAVLLLVGVAPKAEAALEFSDACVAAGEGQRVAVAFAEFAAYQPPFGMSCQDVQKLHKNMKSISIALLPLQGALMMPGAREALLKSAAAYGITAANPVVVSVVVVGAIGVGTIYIVLNNALEECQAMEQQELHEAISRHLGSRYGVHSDGTESLSIQR